MKENFDDYWKVSYNTDGYNKFVSTISVLHDQRLVNFELLRLPAPIEVLINEYDSTFLSRLENRDIFSADRKTSNKIVTIKRYIDACADASSVLYITDPYLFPRSFDSDYPEILIDLLIYTKVSIIKVITHDNYNAALYKMVKSKINNKDIQLFTSDKFHDRFWITNKIKGFVMGTSLNGIGKSISCINRLSSTDAISVYQEIRLLLNI